MTTDLERVFQPGWKNSDSLSGSGSSTKNTEKIAPALRLLQNLLRSETGRGGLRINDVGCGDLLWARRTFSWCEYRGFDVCEWPTWAELREDGWDLRKVNAVEECLPDADLTVVRDVMIHLPNAMGIGLLENVEASSRWLLATTYLNLANRRPFTNEDRDDRIKRPTRQYARLDLRRPPFSLGEPLLLVPEYLPGKCLGLWDLHPGR
jgi:hypothetical protein